MRLTNWIYRWWFFALLIVMVPLLINLGIWQLGRAEQKSELVKHIQLNEQIHTTNIGDNLLPYSNVALTGKYNSQFFWWDNRTANGQAGYELLVLIEIQNSAYQFALVNLGFVPDLLSRQQLPAVPGIPSRIFWQTQVRLIDMDWLQSQLVAGQLQTDGLAPVLFELLPGQPFGQQSNWQKVTISPEKHTAYAVQWFALALMLLIAITLFIRKNRMRRHYDHSQ